MDTLYAFVRTISGGYLTRFKIHQIKNRLWIMRSIIFFFEIYAVLTTIQFFMRVWYIATLGKSEATALAGLFMMWVFVVLGCVGLTFFSRLRKTVSVFVLGGIVFFLWQNITEWLVPNWTHSVKVFWIFSLAYAALLALVAWLWADDVHRLRRTAKNRLDRLLKNVFDQCYFWYTYWSARLAFNCSLIILLLILTNQFNLLQPYFITIADPFNIGFYAIANEDNGWRTAYDEQVDHAKKHWQPALLYSFSDLFNEKYQPGAPKREVFFPWIQGAAQKYGVSDEVLCTILSRESLGHFMMLPGNDRHDPKKGGLEAGLWHRQPKIHFSGTSAWWPEFMDSDSVYNVFLEYQRMRFIAFWCSFNLSWKYDLVRSYIVECIDDRLSRKEFATVARALQPVIAEAKKRNLNVTDAMIISWHTGSLYKATSPYKQRVAKKYHTTARNLGLLDDYRQWKQSLLTKNGP